MEKHFRLYVRGLIFNNQLEVLLIRKNPNQKFAANKWIFPGGTCEWGEESEGCLRRELLEEVNAQITELKIIGTRTLLISDIHWQGIYYKTQISNLDQLKNCEPEKHADIQWFSFENLPSDMDEIDRKHFKLALQTI